jgi:hypothetical protein
LASQIGAGFKLSWRLVRPLLICEKKKQENELMVSGHFCFFCEKETRVRFHLDMHSPTTLNFFSRLTREMFEYLVQQEFFQQAAVVTA